MNDFITVVQWTAISILLFFSGFELAAQVVGNHMTWSQINWTLPLFYWVLCYVIFQFGKLISDQNSTDGLIRQK